MFWFFFNQSCCTTGSIFYFLSLFLSLHTLIGTLTVLIKVFVSSLKWFPGSAISDDPWFRTREHLMIWFEPQLALGLLCCFTMGHRRYRNYLLLLRDLHFSSMCLVLKKAWKINEPTTPYLQPESWNNKISSILFRIPKHTAHEKRNLKT